MVRRRTGGSGGPSGQLSSLAPPPPAPPARAEPPTAAASMLPGDGAAPANLAPTLPAGIPQDAAFHAVSFAGDRREAAQRLAEAEARFVARYGAPARLIAVPADEYDEYVRLDPRVTPHPRLPTRSVYLIVP